MVRNRNARRPLYGLSLRGGMRLEASRHVWCNRSRVHLRLRSTRSGNPRIGEVRLRVTQRVVAHAGELGLLAIVDGHGHVETVGDGGEALSATKRRAVQEDRGTVEWAMASTLGLV